MVRRVVLLSAIAGLIAGTLSVSPATTTVSRRVTKAYTGHGEAFVASCDPLLPDLDTPTTVGGACFRVAPNDQTVSFSFTDNNILVSAVNADLSFLDAGGLPLDRAEDCGAGQVHALPSGTVMVRVSLYGAALNLLSRCPANPLPPTEGIIVATITGVAAAPGRLVSRPFVAGTGIYRPACSTMPGPPAPDIAVACFAKMAGETKVVVSGQWINASSPFLVQFLDAANAVLSEVAACDATASLTMPSATAFVRAVPSMTYSGYPCPSPAIASEPVYGVFNARFT